VSESQRQRGTVTRWIERAKEGQSTSAQGELFRRYYQQVVGHARRWMTGQVVADEDDVAASVWKTVLRRMPQGQFPACRDREDFECLLAKITFRKAMNLRKWLHAARRHPTQKRDERELLATCGLDERHRRVAELYLLDNQDEAAIARELGLSSDEVHDRVKYVRNWMQKRKYRPIPILPVEHFDAATAPDPGPLESLIAAESLANLDEKYRQVVELLLQGKEVSEIARQLDVCEETVRRRLRYVHKYWEAELASEAWFSFGRARGLRPWSPHGIPRARSTHTRPPSCRRDT
jgi:DNA-directed RNA polymerase specialized sigma24 family protein